MHHVTTPRLTAYSAQNPPYSPIDSPQSHFRLNHHHQRRHTAKGVCICCFFAVLLVLLVLMALNRIHTMLFLKRSHQYFLNVSTRICQAYPSDKRLFAEFHNHGFLTLKEYAMNIEGKEGKSKFHMLVDEVIPVSNNFLDNSQHLFLHRYIISHSNTNNSIIELLFIDYFNFIKFQTVRETMLVRNVTTQLTRHPTCDDYESVRTLWASPNLRSMQQLLFNKFTIPSERLQHAVVLYFANILQWGRVLYIEPLATFDSISSNYNYFNNDQEYIGYSSIDSRVYEGINTATKEPCLARINLLHAYLFGKKHEILGILAMSDLTRMSASLTECNSLGTADFATSAIINYTTSARRLFDLSPVFAKKCE